jgi:hypothetical protein
MSTHNSVGSNPGTPKAPAADSSTQPKRTKAELFVKPDDWFDVNDVSDRCPQIVEILQVTFTEFAAACTTGQQALLAALPAELITSIE